MAACQSTVFPDYVRANVILRRYQQLEQTWSRPISQENAHNEQERFRGSGLRVTVLWKMTGSFSAFAYFCCLGYTSIRIIRFALDAHLYSADAGNARPLIFFLLFFLRMLPPPYKVSSGFFDFNFISYGTSPGVIRSVCIARI